MLNSLFSNILFFVIIILNSLFSLSVRTSPGTGMPFLCFGVKYEFRVIITLWKLCNYIMHLYCISPCQILLRMSLASCFFFAYVMAYATPTYLTYILNSFRVNKRSLMITISIRWQSNELYTFFFPLVLYINICEPLKL